MQQKFDSSMDGKESKDGFLACLSACDKVAMLVTAFPFALGVLTVLAWKSLHPALVSAILLYPIIVLPVIFMSDGKIKFIHEKDSADPDISIGMIAIFILQIIIADRYSTFYTKQFFLWCAGYAASYVLIAFILFFKEIFHVQLGLFVCVFAFFLSVNSVKIINGLYDFSEPKEAVVCVTGFMSSSAGRHGHYYYLKIEPHADDNSDSCCIPEKIQVSKSFYNKVKKGDAVGLSIHDGCLGIRWYTYRIKHIWKGKS
ncbi:MAG: hypothetical protein K6G00_07330 [Treponema sp.]|nr:hypothetical protein [Treponema sp.]